METRFVALDGERVQAYRIGLYLTQERLAEQVGVTKSTIERIEHNKIRPRLRVVQQLAEKLHTTPQDLEAQTPERLLGEIDRLSRNLLHALGTSPTDFLSGQLRATFEQYRARLEKLQQGEWVLDNVETPPLAIQCAKNLHCSLLATAFWPDDPMPQRARHEYLHYQAQAATQGVQVYRLFIIEPGMEADPALQARMQHDLDCNFLVKYRYGTDWLNLHGISAPVDVGVWDENYVWLYPSPDVHGERIGSPVIYRNPVMTSHYQEVVCANWHDKKSIVIARA